MYVYICIVHIVSKLADPTAFRGTGNNNNKKPEANGHLFNNDVCHFIARQSVNISLIFDVRIELFTYNS